MLVRGNLCTEAKTGNIPTASIERMTPAPIRVASSNPHLHSWELGLCPVPSHQRQLPLGATRTTGILTLGLAPSSFVGGEGRITQMGAP